MQAKTQESGYRTVEDWEALPAYPRYELMDGVFCMMADPSTSHQSIGMELSGQLWAYLRGKQCRAFYETAVRFREADTKTVVRPDILVVCNPSKIKQGYILGAPDLIIEILSPSTAGNDKIRKLNRYLAEGVREYWIVDPTHQVIDVFDWRGGMTPPVTYDRESKLPVNVLEGCVIDLSAVFT